MSKQKLSLISIWAITILASCSSDFEKLEGEISSETKFPLEIDNLQGSKDDKLHTIFFKVASNSENLRSADKIKGIVDKHLDLVGNQSECSFYPGKCTEWEKPTVSVELRIGYPINDTITGRLLYRLK